MGERGHEGLKLHLGCAEKRLPGFVHVDIRPEVKPDHVADWLNLSFAADHTADLIYFSHGIEHIRKPDIGKALAEWHRVLKPHGILRLATTDFQAVAGLYVDERVTLIRLSGMLIGRQNYEDNTHYSLWDYELLAWTLGENGFYDIQRWNPDKVHPPDFDDFSRAKINGVPISLNVEAKAKG